MSLEGPLDILVLGKAAAEGTTLGAAEPQQAVVDGQHGPVEGHHLTILVIGQDVVEGEVADHGRVGQNQLHVLLAVDEGGVPELEEGLLIGVHRDARLRQLGVEEGPEVGQVGAQQQLLRPTQQQVGHHLEVGGQLGRAVQPDVDVVAAELEEGKEVGEQTSHRLQALVGLQRVANLVGRSTAATAGGRRCRPEGLAQVQ